ncbi:MAG: lysozyme [Dehalococcoidia bacterium]|nr:lysozyme [Dehalococcoidia bacterium]
MSDAGLALIAGFEGMVLHLYNDPAGNCTVGIGRLVHLGACDGRAGEAPYAHGITEARAYELLREDVATFEGYVRTLVSVPLEQHQFNALVSFCYNVGVGSFQVSALRHRLNAADYAGVCEELKRWIYGSDGVVYEGLVRRREAECALFNGEGEDVARLEELEEEVRRLRDELRSGQDFQNKLHVGAYGAIDFLSKIAVSHEDRLVRLGAPPPQRAGEGPADGQD